MRRLVSAFFVAVIVLGVSSACQLAKVDFAAEDVVGRWKSSDGAELLFEAGGRFTATRIPFRILEWEDSPQPGAYSGGGAWEIDQDPRGNDIVELSMEEYPDFERGPIQVGTALGASGSGESLVLHFTLGDRDNMDRYEFVKQTS